MTYPTLNASGMPELLAYANTVTENIFGVGLVLAIYFIVLIFLLMRGDFMLDSMVIAGWISVFSGAFLFLLSLLTGAQFFVLVSVFSIPLIFVYFSRDKE